MTAYAAVLKTLVEKFEADEVKASAGNQSAATRARKTLMEIKKCCGTARDGIQKARGEAAQE